MFSMRHLLPASDVQGPTDVYTVGHKRGWLQRWTIHAVDATPLAGETKLALVSSHTYRVFQLLNVPHAVEMPRSRLPRMFMEVKPPLLPLVHVDLNAKLHMSFRLLDIGIVSLHPRRIHAVHMLVQLL